MREFSMNRWFPQDQVAWYWQGQEQSTCHQDTSAEVVIIGGGMAGLSAAQAFQKKGKKVIVLEQYYCGSGATGKSSGFITPNAEISFTEFSKKYSPTVAHHLWDFITSGVNDIRHNIQHYNFKCDYLPQDTLMLANTHNDFKTLAQEHENLARFGYKTHLYDQNQVRHSLGSTLYAGGVTYEETFGINPYLYCQELKKQLQALGVTIYEETAATAINGHIITTPHAKITADMIVVCTDRFMPELGLLTQDVYHIQTFLMRSEQLTEKQVRLLFPQQTLQCWDSEMVYNYFRITPDNRLLLGGGNIRDAYATQPTHDSAAMFKKLTDYFNKYFPLVDIQFKQMWPGLIGLSKDIAPLAGRDKDMPYRYYIAASAGLPIAAALGRYSAENLLDGKNDLDVYFSPYRHFAISGITQKIIGTKLTFAVSNLMKR